MVVEGLGWMVVAGYWQTSSLVSYFFGTQTPITVLAPQTTPTHTRQGVFGRPPPTPPTQGKAFLPPRPPTHTRHCISGRPPPTVVCFDQLLDQV